MGDINVPTLVITAEHDIPACLEIADLLYESVPKSKKVVMSGTGHLMHMEQPQIFNKTLDKFLKGLRDGG